MLAKWFHCLSFFSPSLNVHHLLGSFPRPPWRIPWISSRDLYLYAKNYPFIHLDHSIHFKCSHSPQSTCSVSLILSITCHQIRIALKCCQFQHPQLYFCPIFSTNIYLAVLFNRIVSFYWTSFSSWNETINVKSFLWIRHGQQCNAPSSETETMVFKYKVTITLTVSYLKVKTIYFHTHILVKMLFCVCACVLYWTCIAF